MSSSPSVRRLIPVVALLAVGAGSAFGQPLPTSQPKILTIYREQIKIGHSGAHVKTEAGWPAAFAKANSPDYYLALASITGQSEVWFISPWDSYTAWGKSMARDAANQELTAELDRLSMVDAEHVDGLRIIEALARPELSHGEYPDLNKARFWDISVMRVRPGHDAQLAAAAGAYKAAADRASVTARWRMYQVTDGMPEPTVILFSSTESFGEFDGMLAGGEAMVKAMTPDELAAVQRFAAEGIISTESNRFRLDPDMSYVSAETKAADPAFWSKKR